MTLRDALNRSKCVLDEANIATLWHEVSAHFGEAPVAAGLLNLLAIFDAYGGPLVLPPPEDKKKRDEPQDAAPASPEGKP